METVHSAMCLLIFIALTHKGVARLSYLGGWLGTDVVYPLADGYRSH